jgi:hypothetical protein
MISFRTNDIRTLPSDLIIDYLSDIEILHNGLVFYFIKYSAYMYSFTLW